MKLGGRRTDHDRGSSKYENLVAISDLREFRRIFNRRKALSGVNKGMERSTCKVGAWGKRVLDRSVTGRDGCAVWVREAARRTGCMDRASRPRNRSAGGQSEGDILSDGWRRCCWRCRTKVR